VDFSEPASRAFEYALALSQRHGAELVALQAVPTDEAFNWYASERRALFDRLQKRAARANVELIERVQQGDPAEIILLHARSLRPDAIVIGTNQRRGFERLRRGSVAEQVAAKATVPVLLVPQDDRDTHATRASTHVAVAVDFGVGTERALELASAMATAPTDAITLVHVVTRSSLTIPAHLHAFGVTVFDDPAVRDAEERLRALAADMKRHTAASVATQVPLGDPSTEIAKVARGVGADVLVVGVSERSFVSRAFFGTTGARLVRSSRIPILAVPRAAATTVRGADTPLPLAA
jgi:nucleotide-binding universal stress UspA family protein